jgi:RecA-family ATPase
MLAGEFSRELADAGRTLTGPDLPEVVSAADWLATPPPAVDEIVEGLFETGDKVAIIGPSKMRKSFLTLQLALSVASGRDFLGWRVPKPRDVLLVQFEVKGAHYHRRLRHVAEAAQLDPGNRLQIVNGRGRGLTVAAVQRIAERRRPALVIFDPLFRLVTGEENAAEGMKPVLLAFDALAETCGAAVTYVHHDGKGDPAERDIRDRGAGSGVLGRDYDAGLTLTQHRDVPDAVVLATLTRNYPPAPAAVIQWQAGRFVRVDGVAAVAGRPGRYDDAIRDFLRANPGASVKVISEAVGCDPSTASRVRARLRGIA